MQGAEKLPGPWAVVRIRSSGTRAAPLFSQRYAGSLLKQKPKQKGGAGAQHRKNGIKRFFVGTLDGSAWNKSRWNCPPFECHGNGHRRTIAQAALCKARQKVLIFRIQNIGWACRSRARGGGAPLGLSAVRRHGAVAGRRRIYFLFLIFWEPVRPFAGGCRMRCAARGRQQAEPKPRSVIIIHRRRACLRKKAVKVRKRRRGPAWGRPEQRAGSGCQWQGAPFFRRGVIFPRGSPENPRHFSQRTRLEGSGQYAAAEEGQGRLRRLVIFPLQLRF